jgi:hypothetical protein
MNLDPTTRIALETLYRVLLPVVQQLALVLGKPCPVQTREERRAERRQVTNG